MKGSVDGKMGNDAKAVELYSKDKWVCDVSDVQRIMTNDYLARKQKSPDLPVEEFDADPLVEPRQGGRVTSPWPLKLIRGDKVADQP